MYQIRQDNNGIFLGNFLGIDVWTITGLNLPSGIKVYESLQEAKSTIDSMLNAYAERNPGKYTRKSFHIEKVDMSMDLKIIHEGLRKFKIGKGWAHIIKINKYFPNYTRNPHLN